MGFSRFLSCQEVNCPALFQVVIFQEYTNGSPVPIEAKYVFPLGESAAVCGFEAFINGKHVVGQVRSTVPAGLIGTGKLLPNACVWAAGEGEGDGPQGLQAGRGAGPRSLPDGPGRPRTPAHTHRPPVPPPAGPSVSSRSLSPQDVFTISVGNLPPAASVLVKVTYVSELVVQDGSVLFSLPGSVAPWQESAALNQTTQVRRGWIIVPHVHKGEEVFHVFPPGGPAGDAGEGVRER